MNDLLKLHKTVGGNGLNKLTYREYLDEHFNLGELKGVLVENNKLNFYPISTFLELNGEDFEDKSLNNHSITKTGNVSIVDTDIGKSYYFNATLGGIDLPQNTITINKTYSIETLVRFKGNPTDYHVIFHQGSSSYDIRLSIPTARTTIDFHYWNGSTTNQGCGSITLPKALDLNVWYKLTFIFVAETLMFKVYLDDVFIGDKKCTSLPTLKSGVQRIGANASSGGYANLEMKYINFYNYDLIAYEPPTEGYRISPPIQLPRNVVSSKIDWEGEGKMSYTPITSNDCIDEDTLFYLKGDAIKDYSIYNRNIVNNNVDIIDDELFGKCLSMPQGSNKYLNVSIPVDFSTRDFTIDWWENVTANGDTFQANGVALNGTGGFIGLGNSTGNQRLLTYTDSSNSYKYSASFGNQPFNEWVHWAIVRKGTTCKVYLNGKLALTQTIPTLRPHTGDWCIGKYYPNAINQAVDTLNGKIANFRVSNKVIWDEEFTPVINIPVKTYTPVKKGESINSLPHNFHLKQEVKGEETISNVKLEMKYKPKKEYIRPSDLLNNEEEDTNKTYLYKPGDECTSLTGGWGITNSSYNVTTPTYERTDRLRAHIVCGNSNGHHCGFISNKAIDLTPYSKIYFDMSNYHTDEYNRGLIAIKSGSSNVASIGSPAYENAPRQIREIDISNINTSCTIQITAETVWNGKQAEVVIYNIWLEK